MGHIAPEDLLRALLDDPVIAGVLAAVGTSDDELRIALERRFLTGLGAVDEATLRGRRVDVGALLHALNTGSAALDGVPPATKAVLARALRESAAMRASRISTVHLLVALLASHDPVVSPAAADVGLRASHVRRVVARRGPLAG